MRRYKFLDQVNQPGDLRQLDKIQLAELCGEIRHFLLQCVSRTGGHLASNLGAVELTVALHRVFESPKDLIMWDVGHQCYTHKLLTGRKNRMNSLRKKGGLSGFTKTKESPHDTFVSGHSSTSIAVVDGIVKAKRLKGEPGRVIAVIGDGAFTGGMAYEGLNNAARGGNPIIILNDNHMSISKNTAAVSKYLTKLRTNPSYFQLKDLTKSAVGAVPVVGDRLVDVLAASKAQLKNIVYSTSLFEDMGFVHMGPVDGHDLNMLLTVFERAKSLDKPVLIHVETVKGKGYLPAEENPGAYHGVGPFDLREGVPQPGEDSFSAVFGKHLTQLAHKDRRICAVTAAMKYGTGLNYFSREFKRRGRFFDVGIAEQHGVTFAAGLASQELIPVFAVYSSFLQRGYDQLLHDCAIEPRHVVFAVDRAGLVGEDGETHQGLFDCPYLTTVPGMTIYSPASYEELRGCLDKAILQHDGLCAVRYPRGKQPPAPEIKSAFYNDNWALFGSEDADILLVTYGRLYEQAIYAARSLQIGGINTAVLKLTKVWPIEDEIIQKALEYKQIYFIEEGMKTGGIAQHMLVALHEQGYAGRMHIRAVEDFVPQGSVTEQMADLGLDAKGIVDMVKQSHMERKTS